MRTHSLWESQLKKILSFESVCTNSKRTSYSQLSLLSSSYFSQCYSCCSFFGLVVFLIKALWMKHVSVFYHKFIVWPSQPLPSFIFLTLYKIQINCSHCLLKVKPTRLHGVYNIEPTLVLVCYVTNPLKFEDDATCFFTVREVSIPDSSAAASAIKQNSSSSKQ